MARWYESANEASFKPVPGGHVFGMPRLFGRPRYYLVNEAQKVEIARCLRRWRLALLWLAAVLLPLTIVTVIFLMVSFRLPPAAGFGVVLVMVPLGIIPHVYLMRMLGPLVARLPQTDQRITLREQYSTIATTMSMKLLVVGIAGGALMIVGGILALATAIEDGRTTIHLIMPVIPIGFGVLMTAYFVGLARLRAKATRADH